jgi:dinuclear metal center YbgI/SA1388 family protein
MAHASSMLTVNDLSLAMDRIAPLAAAESWDNVGLILGSPDAPLGSGPVVLTIDLSEAVVADAISKDAAAIVSYHPPVFEPLKRLTGDSARGRALLACAARGVAVYSPHTALDAAVGGMADWLADGLFDPSGGVTGDRRALVPCAPLPERGFVNIVTFVPPEAVETVRNGLATAGAGVIGKYTVCSFGTAGLGTFLGAPDTNPAVGEPGKLEQVPEIRLEMVCPRRALPVAIATLRQFHPYEEPAVHVYSLEPLPERAAGAGRRVMLDQPEALATLVERVRAHLKVGPGAVHLGRAVSGVFANFVSRIGVCPGAGGALAPIAVRDGCELFITGEMKHHEVLACVEGGMSVLLAGHTNTERGYLPVLAERLATEMGVEGARVVVSAADRSPLDVV